VRLASEEKDIEHPLIPKLLKDFYRCTGVIRNIQLHEINLFKYITENSIEQPEEYIRILSDEKTRWQNEAVELMSGNDLQDEIKSIHEKLPGSIDKSTVKKFIGEKLRQLKEALKQMNDEAILHTIRKILKDLLYTWNYIKGHADLPEAIDDEDKLRSLTAQLGDFMDKCIGLEFLEPVYLDKIENKKEKQVLLKIKDEWQDEKFNMIQELGYRLIILDKQLSS
jgi:hypothetical protein